MKWYWTPYGAITAVVTIALLAGAAFVENQTLQTAMIVFGLLALLFGYIRTYLNIKKINKEVRKEQERQAKECDKEADDSFRIP